jgi:hypothetical protein
MSEEVKIEAGKSMLKGFLTNPISWFVGLIAVGSFLFGLGASSANHKSDVSGLSVKVDNLTKSVTQYEKKVDYQTNSQDSLKTAVINYVQKSDVLQRSYVKWVQEHSATINDVAHYLEGMQIELIPPEPNSDKSIETPKPVIKYQLVNKKHK